MESPPPPLAEAHPKRYFSLPFPLPGTFHSPRHKKTGLDLQGNTYWEFRIAGVSERSRWRRMVHYPGSTHHSDVKVPPLWHQWLRYTRNEAPSLDEQRGDVTRQARLKILAAEADRRWEAKPRVMCAEETRRLEGRREVAKEEVRETKVVSEQQGDSHSQRSRIVEKGTEEEKKDPWAKARAMGPSEDWQPESWKAPQPAKRT
jgi:NADH dehydrogenase [ubiquinone] 1 alpha subcomplex assembly factor 2